MHSTYSMIMEQQDNSYAEQDRTDGTKFYHAAKKGKQFKAHELSISGMFHLMLPDLSWLSVTKTIESNTQRGINYTIL